MKRSLPLLLLGGVLLVQPAAIAQESAEPTMLTHRVAEVTVYRDRALVTRRGGSLLARGVQEVVFEKLPNALDENSIRASGEGSARFKILGVEMRREYVKPAESGELATLQARQREINDRLNAIGGERENLDEQRQFLRQMRDKVLADTKKVSETSRVVSVGSLEELFAFYVQELAAIGERQRALQIEERTLNEEQTELRQKMALVQRPSSPDTRTAVVKVEVSQPGQAQFDLSYLIRGATWTPQYDAVARRPDQKVALTYYGVVRQTT
ncbi:MAG: mucoidy inhibitor MuiA family protein, partial [Verrucomicrobiota bacterium]